MVTQALHPLLDELVRGMAAEVVAVDAEQARLARRAYADYGKGVGRTGASQPRRLLLLRARQGDGAPPALQG